MYKIIIRLIFIIGISLHIYFLQINEIVKTTIGFENIKQINEFKNLSLSGIGDGTSGFLYSLLIAPLDIFLKNHLLSAQIINIILLLFSGILLFNLGKKYLHPTYNTLMIILFFISSNIINYTNKISDINIYIPLFLLLILLLHKLLSETSLKSMNVKINGINVKINNNIDIIKKSILVGSGLGLLFFETNISIIYLIAIFIILTYFLIIKKLSIKILLISYSTVLITFLIIISPYIYISGIKLQFDNLSKIIIKSKIISTEKNKEIGLQKAIGTFSPNKMSLISGSNGGELGGFTMYLKHYFNLKNNAIIFIKNEKDLFINILPNMALGNIIDSYKDKNFIFYNNKIFFVFLLIPLLFFVFGIYKLLFDKKVYLTQKRYLLPITFSLFLILAIFSGFFIVQESNVIIFLPIIILIICFGAQNSITFDSTSFSAMKFLTILFIFVFIYMQGTIHIFTYTKYNDLKYKAIKEMGLWLKDNKKDGVNIMEILPIVSYYSGENKTRIVPYTNKIADIISYAKANKIDYLVVDSSIFIKYRPDLKYIQEDNYKNSSLEKIKEIKKIGQKIILYKFKF